MFESFQTPDQSPHTNRHLRRDLFGTQNSYFSLNVAALTTLFSDPRHGAAFDCANVDLVALTARIGPVHAAKQHVRDTSGARRAPRCAPARRKIKHQRTALAPGDV